jgi:large subunit ribosomal protein L5
MSPAKKPAAKKVTTPKKKTTTKKPEKTIDAQKTKTSKPVKKPPVKKKPKLNPEEKQKLFIPKIEKVTVNIGVGEAGERLKKAENLLQNLTGHKPVETLSKITSKDWALRKRMPIGCKVTLRGKDAHEFLKEALTTRENKMADYSFDDEGNLSFGIPDHTLFKTQKYDPKVGIFGMDICITMKKPGYRVKHRRMQKRKIPQRHKVKKDETIKFFSETYKVEVIK